MKNRVIKFRFWDKNLKKMSVRKPAYNDFNHKNIIPLEYIGLKDKNGIEIYEGDYLVDEYPINEEDLSKGMNQNLTTVVWCDTQLMWCIDASFDLDGSFLTSLVDYYGKHLEVKGNIFTE